MFHSDYKECFDYPENVTIEDDFLSLLKQCDFMLVLGGDGTIIHSAKHAAQADKPLLGINAGYLGFTANLETSELDEVLKLLDGDYTIEERMLLKISVYDKSDNFIDETECINDAVVSRGSASRIIDINVELNGHSSSNYRADGVIFATPTGSTAYALSAGGPIIDPSVGCIELVPICPHSLLSRPIIYSADSSLKVTFPKRHNASGPKCEAFLTVDGEKVYSLNDGEAVLIRKSDIYAKFIKINKSSFSDILQQKIIDNDRKWK
ncbi:MAG: NAD(+)/NADH kinase [Clostridia bacterium]|nr:NAD(+)/NADH kinase [Clostridia bacterium]